MHISHKTPDSLNIPLRDGEEMIQLRVPSDVVGLILAFSNAILQSEQVDDIGVKRAAQRAVKIVLDTMNSDENGEVIDKNVEDVLRVVEMDVFENLYDLSSRGKRMRETIEEKQASAFAEGLLRDMMRNRKEDTGDPETHDE